MLSTKLQEQLQALHPEGATELVRINQLARETTDSALLDLCSGYLDAMLRDQTWAPPHPLTDRDKAFLAFTEQFVTSVSTMTDEQVTSLLDYASADEVYSFVNSLYVIDMTRRIDLVAGRVLT